MSSVLQRSTNDKILAGVAGGLASYWRTDPVFIRLAFVLLTIFWGGGLLIYLILWIAMPAEAARFQDMEQQLPETDTQKSTDKSLILGLGLVALGLIFLLNILFPIIHFRNFWPVILIIAGVFLLWPDGFRGNWSNKKTDADHHIDKNQT